jgi:hypothetical protein
MLINCLIHQINYLGIKKHYQNERIINSEMKGDILNQISSDLKNDK